MPPNPQEETTAPPVLNLDDAVFSIPTGEAAQVNPVTTPNIAEIERDLRAHIEITKKEFIQRIEERETKTIEILAIFITLFTFISVNVNIFTKAADAYTAIWFMLIMTACSVALLSFMFIVINTKNDWKKWIGLLLVLCFLSFLILVSISSNWNPKLNGETVTRQS